MSHGRLSLSFLALFALAACNGSVTLGNQSPDTAPPKNTFDDLPEAVVVGGDDSVVVVGGANTEGAAFHVRKLNAQGELLWRRAYGQGAFVDSYGVAADIDAAGNLILAGMFTRAGTFGKLTLTPLGAGDAFALKLDPNGEVLWARSFGTAEQVWGDVPDGPSGYMGVSTGASSVAFDGHGNVLLAGEFSQHVDFGQGALDASNGDDFVVKLDAGDGHSVWSHQIADSWLPVVTRGVNDDVLVASSRSLASPTAGTVVTKLDATGTEVFRRTFKGQGADAVRVDASGNVYLAGSFMGSVDFGTGAMTAGSSFNVFAVKLDPDGNAVWSRPLAGPDFIANAHLVLRGDELTLAADCVGTASLGGVSMTSQGGRDVCVVRLSAQGDALAINAYGTPLDDGIAGIAVNSSGAVILAGVSWDNSVAEPRQGFLANVPLN